LNPNRTQISVPLGLFLKRSAAWCSIQSRIRSADIDGHAELAACEVLTHHQRSDKSGFLRQPAPHEASVNGAPPWREYFAKAASSGRAALGTVTRRVKRISLGATARPYSR
jgi:hypothetical protein